MGGIHARCAAYLHGNYVSPEALEALSLHFHLVTPRIQVYERLDPRHGGLHGARFVGSVVRKFHRGVRQRGAALVGDIADYRAKGRLRGGGKAKKYPYKHDGRQPLNSMLMSNADHVFSLLNHGD